eukprot:SAG11_NODE_3196_length_2617_cov_17.217633_4_plen_78_part_00
MRDIYNLNSERINILSGIDILRKGRNDHIQIKSNSNLIIANMNMARITMDGVQREYKHMEEHDLLVDETYTRTHAAH